MSVIVDYQRAQDAWTDELRRLFGKRAGDVRYTSQGRGEPGMDLNRLWIAQDKARIAWEVARGVGTAIPKILGAAD